MNASSLSGAYYSILPRSRPPIGTRSGNGLGCASPVFRLSRPSCRLPTCGALRGNGASVSGQATRLLTLRSGERGEEAETAPSSVVRFTPFTPYELDKMGTGLLMEAALVRHHLCTRTYALGTGPFTFLHPRPLHPRPPQGSGNGRAQASHYGEGVPGRRHSSASSTAPSTAMPIEIACEIEKGPTSARGSPRRNSMPKRMTA